MPLFAPPAARSSPRFAAATRTYSRSSSALGPPRAMMRSTSGCSGASTKNVAPKSVSGRVVKTGIVSPSSSSSNSTSAPLDRPIQCRWAATTRSGHRSAEKSSS